MNMSILSVCCEVAISLQFVSSFLILDLVGECYIILRRHSLVAEQYNF